MKHFIRNTTTRKYFDHGHWTRDIAHAQQFDNALSAISFSLQSGLRNAELVVVLGSKPSEKDIRFPLAA